MQIPLGDTFKDPGCFASSAAAGKSSPVTVSASVEGITSAAAAAAAATSCYLLLLPALYTYHSSGSYPFTPLLGDGSPSLHADKDPSFL